MEENYKNFKVLLALCLSLMVYSTSVGQTFLAASAATARVANMSLGEGLASTERQMLLNLVTKSGLMPVLSGSEAYTFFAPSEQSLQQYQDAKPEELRQLLSQHIVKGSLTSADLKDGSTIKSINGNTIRVYRKKGAVIVNGMRVKEADQMFANGVWHQLNGCFTSAVTE